MLATLMYGPGDVRCEAVDDPKILKPTDAIIKLSATCICGSDLWPYRGLQPTDGPAHMGHEYCGVVVEIGSEVKTVRPGQFVVGSFCISDNTCPHCRFGFHSSCVQREFMSGAQAPYARVPLADGTLVATAELPSADLIPHLLATSDVLGTGWYAADAANVREGSTVVVVGDGAVGLMGVLAAREMGAGRIIAMSRHAARQKLATELGATDIVAERGEEGIARIKDLTGGVGADSGVRRHAAIDDAGDRLLTARRVDRLCRRASRGDLRRRGDVLRAAAHARRTGAGPALPAGPDRARPRRQDQAGQGVRSQAAAVGGGRGIPRHGRAARDQDVDYRVRISLRSQ